MSNVEHPTVCVLCSHNCGVRITVEGGKINSIRGDTDNPITQGYVCNKAFGFPHYIDHAQRVRHPMRRRSDGTHERVSWDVAVADIGARLASLRRDYGPQSIALVGVGGQGNHLDVPYAISFLLALGSPWWFNALAQEKSQHGLVDSWMFGAAGTGYLHPDAEHTRYLLVMGTNPVVSNRGHNPIALFKAIKSDPERTLVVVDPRRTESARGATEHVAVRVGTDTYLLLGLAAYIVRERLCDEDFLRDKAQDVDKIQQVLREIDPAEMAERAGIPTEQLTRVARGFAAAESAGIFADLGVEQAPFSTLNSYLMRVLLALTGNLGNRGGNVFLGTFSPAVPQWTQTQTPFRAPVSGIASIPMLGPVGMFSPNLLAEEITATRPDRIRAIVCEAANPLIQAVGTQGLRSAFAELELLVVIDPAFTETSKLAHYVLPAPVGYEKWEYSGFPKAYPEIYAQVRPPVVAGPDEALPEAEIFARLAKAAGLIEPTPRVLHWLAKRAHTSAGAAAFLAAAGAAALLRTRNPKALSARVTFWTLDALGPHLAAPALSALWLLSHVFALTQRKNRARVSKKLSGEAIFQELMDHPEGVEVARLDVTRNLADACGHADGRIHLSPEPMLAELNRALSTHRTTNSDFPLVLNGGLRTRWNANTIQRDPAWRKGRGPHCAVFIHPSDAAAIAVSDGAVVDVETRAGSVRLPATLDDSVQPGNVLIPNGFGLEYPDPTTGQLRKTGVAVNELTDAADRDPFTGCPHLKFIPCRVRAVADEA